MILSQVAQSLDLQWTANDPVSLSFVVQGADWSGTYLAQVRLGPDRSSGLLATLSVSAVYAAPNTTFVLTLANSSGVPLSGGFWDLQQVGGVTRLAGKVFVVKDVSI